MVPTEELRGHDVMSIYEVISAATLPMILIAGTRFPGALLAGCFFTYQASSLANQSWIGIAYIAIAAVITLFKNLSKAANLTFNLSDAAIVLMMSYFGLSTQWSGYQRQCLWEFFILVQSVGGMYAIARLNNQPLRQVLIPMLVTLICAGTLLSICMLGERVVDDAGEAGRLVIGNENATPVGLSMPLPFVMLSCVVLALRERRLSVLTALLLSLTVVTYCAILSATRGVFIAFLAGTLGTILLSGKSISKKKAWSVLGVGTAFLTIFVTLLPERIVRGPFERLLANFSGQGVVLDRSAAERVIAYRDGEALFTNNPFQGSGYGSFKYYSFLDYPHNMFIEIASTTGVIGVSLLVFWLFSVARSLLRLQRLDRLATATCAGIFIASLVHMQLSFSFFMGRPLFLISALVASVSLSSLNAPVRGRRSRLHLRRDSKAGNPRVGLPYYTG